MEEKKKYVCPDCGEVEDYSTKVNQQCNPYLVEVICNKCNRVIATPYELKHKYEAGRGVTAYLERREESKEPISYEEWHRRRDQMAEEQKNK